MSSRDFLNHRQRPSYIRFAIVFVLVWHSGCGSKSSLGRVQGTVTLNGKPLASGTIATLPGAGRGAHGLIHDGKFELGTFGSNDGAVVGTHRVAISAFEPSQGAGPEAKAAQSIIPDRYTNPSTSSLTIDVKADGENTPELKLTSP